MACYRDGDKPILLGQPLVKEDVSVTDIKPCLREVVVPNQHI